LHILNTPHHITSQVQEQDGTWVMYLLYHSDKRVAENNKALDNIARDEFKETAFKDASQWRLFIDDHTR
jgi:hypothetical protein